MHVSNSIRKKNAGERGFIALISALIISVALFFAILANGQRGISGRLMLLDVERKLQSEGLAEACVNVARISIINDPLYVAGTTSVTVGNSTCTLIEVVPNTPLTGQSRIRTKGVVTGATTNIEAVASSTSADIVSWKEIPNF